MLVPVDNINSAMALSAHSNALSVQTCGASDTAKYYISIKTLKRKVGLFVCVFITSKRHIVVKGEHEQGLCTKIFFVLGLQILYKHMACLTLQCTFKFDPGICYCCHIVTTMAIEHNITSLE